MPYKDKILSKDTISLFNIKQTENNSWLNISIVPLDWINCFDNKYKLLFHIQPKGYIYKNPNISINKKRKIMDIEA